MIYAIIKSDGIVKGISELTGSVDKPDMVEIKDFDESLIGKRWTGSEFVDSGILPPEPVDPLKTIKAQLVVIQTKLDEIKIEIATIPR